nr:MAG TPA: hypothetical protein [Caudoviricetes sp.]
MTSKSGNRECWILNASTMLSGDLAESFLDSVSLLNPHVAAISPIPRFFRPISALRFGKAILSFFATKTPPFPAPPRQKQAFIHTIGYPLSSTLRRCRM